MKAASAAEPFQHVGRKIESVGQAEPADERVNRRVAVVLCHGFTGSPASMRPWAEHLAAAGYGVELPLLPGHGTTWPDLNRTGWPDWFSAVERSLLTVASTYDTVVVAGLSMGGCLALRLAQVHGDLVDGLVLVNPAISHRDPRFLVLPVMRHFVPSLSAISSDVARPDVDEIAYDRTPLHALYSQTKMWRLVRRDLPMITQPIQLFHSATDHVLDESSLQHLLRGVSSSDVRDVVLPRSFHVATMDYDAPTIFDGSVEFIERISGEASS